ncbi:methyltransferase [Aureispira sp. CCB-QB1]|uniref:methyltransferase n=1 Tax=Aureispira sp. CCB-QB1 TaxID=1313421 RepID=UPI0006972D5A|nr:methyltransferase [Aureispira sp. CCB-QB1]
MIDRIRRQFRRLTQPILWRLYKAYLSKTRWFNYDGLSIKVAPSVFHPGLLFSTKILAQFALNLELKGSKVLELGAGSGLIASLMAREGFLVTASDINPIAVRSILETKDMNNLELEVIESDLLKNIPPTIFQYILINPPYFPQEPTNNREKAFFCGQNFEYFHNLFSTIGTYMQVQSSIFMILSDDCAIETIQSIARKHHFTWKLLHEEKVWGETNFIYEITKDRLTPI